LRRKLIFGLVALLAPLGTAVGMGAGTASAHANVTGKGTYNCTKETGTISFSPPLKFTAQTVKTTVKTSASGCTGGTPKVLTEAGNSVTTKPNQSCTGLAGSTPFTIKLTYSNGAAASTLTGTAKGGGTGAATFTITGKTTGSYASASTTAKATLKQTTSQLATLCGGAGISTLNIVSGTVTKA
jgi:hypothetical protein